MDGMTSNRLLTRAEFLRQVGLAAAGVGLWPLLPASAEPIPSPITQKGTVSDMDKVQLLLDRLDIAEVVNRLAVTADTHDWPGLRQCFTDEVFADYTSLAGGQPSTVKADALVDAWKVVPGGFKRTQHLIGNHIITVENKRATCVAYFQATHFLPSDTGGNTWTLGGRYDDELVRTAQGWKISRIKMTVLWAEGNQQLLTQAKEQSELSRDRSKTQ